MIMQKDYMEGRATHHAYYLEIAQAAGLNAGALPVTLENIREAIQTDEHLNNIPLNKWDWFAQANMKAIGRAARERGDVNSHTLGNGVCALKALAKHLATNTETV